MQTAAILSLALVLGACAQSAQVYSVGPDLRRVTASAWTSMGGVGTAKAEAIRKAAATCTAEGKQLEVVSDSANTSIGGASADVTFRCL